MGRMLIRLWVRERFFFCSSCKRLKERRSCITLRTVRTIVYKSMRNTNPAMKESSHSIPEISSDFFSSTRRTMAAAKTSPA